MNDCKLNVQSRQQTLPCSRPISSQQRVQFNRFVILVAKRKEVSQRAFVGRSKNLPTELDHRSVPRGGEESDAIQSQGFEGVLQEPEMDLSRVTLAPVIALENDSHFARLVPVIDRAQATHTNELSRFQRRHTIPAYALSLFLNLIESTVLGILDCPSATIGFDIDVKYCISIGSLNILAISSSS
jgi:hypothetical protein